MATAVVGRADPDDTDVEVLEVPVVFGVVVGVVVVVVVVVVLVAMELVGLVVVVSTFVPPLQPANTRAAINPMATNATVSLLFIFFPL